MTEIVVIGAGYAGLTCALRLGARVRKSGLAARIRLVSPRPVLVERIRLHQLVAGQALPQRPLESLLAGTDVELVPGSAEAIDVDARTVRVDGREMRWDRLVLAAGSRTDLWRVPGAADHAVAVEPESGHHVMRSLSGLRQGARVAVIGGGLTGIEISSEIAESHPHLGVHLVAGEQVAQEFSAAGRSHVVRTLTRRLGVRIHQDAPVLALAARELQTVSTSIPFDLCIWAGGFAASSLASGCGLECNAAGQVLVDPMLRSISHPHVSVAGDMGAPAQGERLPMGCKSAMPMGAHVAENLVRELRGEPLQEFSYALLFYCVSLGRRDGLIQWPDSLGRPAGRVLTGRRAALFKEAICRSTIWAMELERRGIPGVVWKHGGKEHPRVTHMDRVEQ